MVSRDRVRFLLPAYTYSRVTKEEWKKYAVLLAQAFSLRPAEFEDRIAAASKAGSEGIWINCRPSQFARFLILRNNAGFCNDFKGLKAELVQPREEEFIDVSKRPNEYCGEDC